MPDDAQQYVDNKIETSRYYPALKSHHRDDVIKDLLVKEIHKETQLSVELIEEYIENNLATTTYNTVVIASGYEWTCQNCEHLNRMVGIEEHMDCEECGATHFFDEVHHCYD